MPGHAYLDLGFYAFWDQSWSNFHASMQTDNKSILDGQDFQTVRILDGQDSGRSEFSRRSEV